MPYYRFDLQYNTLKSGLAGFVYPKRITRWWRWQLLQTWAKRRCKEHPCHHCTRTDPVGNTVADDLVRVAPDKKEFTPAFFLSYKPFETILNRVYKHIFRMPTFNDFYYTDIGNIHRNPSSPSVQPRIPHDMTIQAGSIRQWHRRPMPTIMK